jgi:hypothetical protein
MPTAFISYSHDDDFHTAKAVSLARRLRQDGVDVSIDAYEPHPNEGWPKWMERQFRRDFLVIILSQRYISEFDQNVPSHSGARYEGAMVSAFLSQRGVTFEAVAIVCFDGGPDLSVPLILEGCTRYYVDRTGEYEKLYAFLTSQVLVEKPPLGSVISLPLKRQVISPDYARSFPTLCKSIWPLMEDNKRIFDDFGPNSEAARPGETERTVRFDLALWKRQRFAIGENNQAIAEQVRANMDLIPDRHAAIFRRLLSHIEAFSHHLFDENLDYRDHQFPYEVVVIVERQL